MSFFHICVIFVIVFVWDDLTETFPWSNLISSVPEGAEEGNQREESSGTNSIYACCEKNSFAASSYFFSTI